MVRRPTLPCVWPMALSSTKRSEVNAWFDQRLRNYLGFLTKSLISPSSTYNASCLAFQKLYVWFIQDYIYCIYVRLVKNAVFLDILPFFLFSVSVLGEYNYTAADFMRQDMFNTIRTYLTSGQSSQ